MKLKTKLKEMKIQVENANYIILQYTIKEFNQLDLFSKPHRDAIVQVVEKSHEKLKILSVHITNNIVSILINARYGDYQHIHNGNIIKFSDSYFTMLLNQTELYNGCYVTRKTFITEDEEDIKDFFDCQIKFSNINSFEGFMVEDEMKFGTILKIQDDRNFKRYFIL